MVGPEQMILFLLLILATIPVLLWALLLIDSRRSCYAPETEYEHLCWLMQMSFAACQVEIGLLVAPAFQEFGRAVRESVYEFAAASGALRR